MVKTLCFQCRDADSIHGQGTKIPHATHCSQKKKRKKENSLLTRLPVYYKRIQLRNSQMKEMHRARYVGRGVPPSQHLHMFVNPETL